MNLFDQISWKSSLNSFLGNKTAPETPAFGNFQQAPRTDTYTTPVAPVKKPIVPIKATPTPVDSLPYKAVKWLWDVFTNIKEGNLQQGIDEKAKFDQEMEAKKQKFVQDKLRDGFTQPQIDWALKILEDKGTFEFKPWLGTRIRTSAGNRLAEMERTTEDLSNETNIAKRLWAWAASYIWDTAVGLTWDPIWAVIEPVVSPVIKKIVEVTGQQENIGELAKWWESIREQYPLLADSIEGIVNIWTTAAPFTKTGQAVIKAPATFTKDAIVWAGKIPWKVVETVKWLVPNAEKSLVKSLWQETAPWMIAWKNVKVPVPQKSLVEKVTFWALRPKDPKVLAWRALTPSYAGKTPKQILSTVWDVEKNVKELYDKVRTWVYKWDLSTLESAANTVVQNLDEIGSKIGNAVRDAAWKIPLSKNREVIKKVLADPIEKRGWAWKILKNFQQDTAPIDGLSIQRAFKAKKIYQAEIKKLIKSGDVWTDAYETLIKWVQELNDSIDNAVANTPWFKEWKAQYSHLKKLVSDISKSAAVEWRRSPQTFVEQLGMVENLMEAVSNPLSTAGKIFAKEIGELNTRWGAWKELIKLYDEWAIRQATSGSMKKSVKPRKVKVTK
jgi:hypothetical protein